MNLIAHVSCRSVAETEKLAAGIAAIAQIGDIIGLSGDLGAGKTTFARGFVRALTTPDNEVPSPTFTLVQSYDTAKGPLWHCDLYRLTKPEDALELGLEEAFGTAMCLIEWPERIAPILPTRRLALTFKFDPLDTSVRHITLDGDERWAERWKMMTS